MPVPTFCRAPLHMRYNRESYFEPRFVSIGPLYHEKMMEQRVMEKAKDKCISYFTRELKTNTISDSLDYLVQNIIDDEMKHRIHRWYGKNFVCLDEFFRMLVRDSCFIIRIILAFSREGEETMFYPGVDIKTVRFDMLLMENQIPFFLLRKVYYFLRHKKMLPPVQSSQDYSSNSQENGMTQSPKGSTYMCCLPIRKQSNVSESTTGQTHSQEPQPTLEREQSQNNISQYTLSSKQNQSHEPQPTLEREQSQNNRSQYTLSLGHSQSHGPQPTLSQEQSQNNGSLYTLSLSHNQNHDPQPTLSLEQSQNNGSQNTLSLGHSQSHRSQPTLSQEQNQNNGLSYTLSTDHSKSHGPQPTLSQEQSQNNISQFTLSLGESQSHGPQPTLCPEQSQNNRPQLTHSREPNQSLRQQPSLSLEQNQSHRPQPTLSQEQSSYHRPQLSVVSLHPSQSSPEITMLLDEFLNELKPFIWLDMPWQFYEHASFTEPKHLLDLYWKWCIPLSLNDEGTNALNQLNDHGMHSSWVEIHSRSNAPKRIKSAYVLHRRAGITFKKREHEDVFDVTFKNGILQIPHLQLDPNQTTLLSNLVAFEEFKPSNERLLTSYVLLLDGLISTEKDVKLLERNGVITNKLSSTQLASAYFNEIGNVCKVNYKDHYCKDQFDALNSYYYSYWNRQCAKLRHKYFNSPWAFISFFAGVVLLSLSAIQTGYSISRYYQHH